MQEIIHFDKDLNNNINDIKMRKMTQIYCKDNSIYS